MEAVDGMTGKGNSTKHVTENGSTLEDVPQYMMWKWDGTVVGDPSKTAQYLSVLIAVPSGLIMVLPNRPVKNGGRVRVSINEEGTLIYVKKNWPSSMYNTTLICKGIDLLLGDDYSNGENITLCAMGAVKEVRALRGQLGINSTQPIYTVFGN
jgi:hypothetical protein